MAMEGLQEVGERARVLQPFQRAMEGEFLPAEKAFQSIDELSAKDFAEHQHG
jgi:hypothetical protein